MVRCSPARAAHTGFTLIELLVVIAMMAVLAAIMFPVFARAREKGRQATCSTHQRQIALELLTHAADHDETLPAAATVWRDLALAPGILRCPTAGTSVRHAYAFHQGLGGVALGDVADVVGTILTVDGRSADHLVRTSQDIAPRHTGRFLASYVDGHVAFGSWTDPDVPRRIVFASAATGNYEVYSMAEDGTDVRQLTDSPGIDWDPCGNAEGSQIVFAARRGTGTPPLDLYRMEADGSHVTRLTNDANEDADPTYNAAGTRIAYTHYVTTGFPPNYEIFLMNADGTGVANLTNRTNNDRRPAFSPDGTQVVFESYFTDNWDICLINTDGTGFVRLTDDPGADQFAAFSPDGTTILFATNRDDFPTGGITAGSELYRMQVDGTNPQRLTTTGTGNNTNPSFNRDGTKIVFSGNRDGGPNRIYVMQADGSGLTPLTGTTAAAIHPSW